MVDIRCISMVLSSLLLAISISHASTEDLARPQLPSKPYPYLEVEVRVVNEAAGVSLAGTLTVPRSDQPVPGVILVPGASPFDRNQTLLGHQPFLVLADHLTRQGLAVLRWDDRGVEDSTGRKLDATFRDLAEDVLEGVRLLEQDERIDAGRIGVIGHSAGALVASLAAADSDKIGFVVLLAGTARPFAELMLLPWREDGEQVYALVQEYLNQLLIVIREGGNAESTDRRVRERWQRMEERLSDEQRESLAPFAENWDRQLSVYLQPYFRDLLIHDPAPVLSRLQCPVLAIVGEKETGASQAIDNFPTLLAALERGPGDYTLMKLDNLNHLLQTSQTGELSEVPDIDETISSAALDAIAAWIRQRT